MITEISKNWWLFLVRGLLTIIFGALALIWPKEAWFVLVVLFGAFALLDGIFATIAGFELHPFFERWWAVLLEGVMGIVIGILTFVWPGTASHVLFYLIAAWAIVSGVFDIVSAIHIRLFVSGEWTLFLAGILSILLGILLVVYPASGLIGLVWVVGIYAIVLGVSEIIFSSRLHGLRNVIKSSGIPAI